MSIFVMAYLGFGVHLTEEQLEELPWAVTPQDEDDEDEDSSEPKLEFEDWVAKVNGIVDPAIHIEEHRDMEWAEWYKDPANKEASSAFWKNKDDAVKQCPIGCINTGGEGDPCVIVAVNSSISDAGWADPEPAVTTISDHDIEAAKAFCAEHSISFENPQWLLVAEYGG